LVGERLTANNGDALPEAALKGLGLIYQFKLIGTAVAQSAEFG
jgi:hypothetical protein